MDLAMTSDYLSSRGYPSPYLRASRSRICRGMTFDLHHLPFTGTVDWPRLARAARPSSCAGCLILVADGYFR